MIRRLLLALSCCLLPLSLSAQTYTISPSPNLLVSDSNNNPVNAACVWQYVAGTTTPATTYRDVSGTANSNPIIVPSTGRITIYLVPGNSYKYVYESPPCSSVSHGAVILTADNIVGNPASSANLDLIGTAGEAISLGQCVYLSDGSGSKTAGQWYKCDPANAYSSTLPVIGMAPQAIALLGTGTIRLGGQAPVSVSLTPGTTYYASTAGALTLTFPTTNARVVGVADSTSTLILDRTPVRSAGTSTITTTGTQTALALPTGLGALTIFANNATVLTLQGIAAGADGQTLDLYSIGAGQVDIANDNGSATAANRVLNGVTGAIALHAGDGRVRLVYDATASRWRVLQHEQGGWITATFAAGNFTSSGGGTWTVAAGDVTTMAYRLSGRTLHVAWYLVTTSVTTTTNSLVVGNGAWGGFTIAKNMTGIHSYKDNAGAEVLGAANAVASGTSFTINRIAAAAWSAATDATETKGEMFFEVN